MSTKKLICATFLFLIAGHTIAQNSYEINGQISNDSLRFNGSTIKKLYLTKLEDGRYINIDSTKVRRKKFTFKGKVPKTNEMYFITGFDNGAISVFLENGKINIAPFQAAYPAAAIPTGTPNNDVLAELSTELKKDFDKSKARMDSLENVMPESIKNDSALSYEYQRAIFNNNSMRIKLTTLNVVLKHMDKPAALYLIRNELVNLFDSKMMEQRVLTAISDSLHEHPVYQELYNNAVAKNMKAGTVVPTLKATTPDGKELALSDLKGRYVLLDFWASWCGPCRKEIPYIKQALATAAGTNKFAVLSFSIDEKENDWKKCIENNKLENENWYHISDLKGWKSPYVALFGVDAVPKTLLINPSGKLITIGLRGEELVQKIKNIMDGTENYE